MRMIFLTASGMAYVESVPPYMKIAESYDGYHPIMREGVYKDRKRQDEAIMVVWNGTICPEGSSMTFDSAQKLLKEVEIMRMLQTKQSVSKMFWRHLMNGLNWMFRIGYPVFFFGIVFYFLYAVALVVGA